ncbi:MAG TPA: hypothetical protein VN922_06505, partial [Bacteroidia bacterium]|nr:hypothetical protein [Bacteroidia bacterium]
MIRDQLYATITTPQPATPSNITYSNETVTVTLPNHGFQTGQNIVVRGGRPSLLNGGYTLTVVDINTFTYQMDDVPSVQITTFPTVVAVYDPVLIHNGGMVDVYCGNTIASQIIQVTTDSNGNAILSGPVYSFKRSSVTGGSSDDTIPFQNNLVYGSYTLDQPNRIFHVAQTAHGLTTGAMVAVSGITQSLAISAISCVGFTVTVVC